ncbi:MAG: type I restriction enzyme HsdR N-terminal domain-containing protein [Spirosomataceae bacterium]
MDFKDQIKQLGDRVTKLKEQIATEEATKNAFIMPFIQTLGFDVFNPIEVVPEYVTDIGTKKGEKIDYAIFKDNEPAILVECKHWQQKLDLHDNQLLRYFHVSHAKFAILTNGIRYRFYTDLEEPNKMDEKPFLEFDISDIKDAQIEELKKFHKSYFNVENIINSASELKFTNAVKTIFSNELKNPSDEFLRFFISKVYTGKITGKILAEFSELVKKSINHVISDMITERFKFALDVEEASQIPESTPQIANNEPIQEVENKIVTTEEELEGFMIIKSICRQKIAVNRICYRDAQSYFAILLDDNNRKPICRLYFNSASKKYISFIDGDKKETKYEITCLDDIFNYSEHMLASIERWENK